VKHEVLQPKQDATSQSNKLVEKSIHLALPVRLTHLRNGEQSLEMACTYDIHPRGARLRSGRDVKVGDLITVERGRTKSVCRVVWTAEPDSALHGQFAVECVEGSRIPWEEELRRMEEQYLPVTPGAKRKSAMNSVRRGQQNRRRRPRYAVNGNADIAKIDGARINGTKIGGESSTAARLEQISEHGCLIRGGETVKAGTALRLVLNLCDVTVLLRGHVKYAAENHTMGVEFEEIRQGDRPLLDYVLDRLKKPRIEDFADLEVIVDDLEVMR
jgi:hypothetical protein